MLENSNSQRQYDALRRIWTVYLHMRAWGSPEYNGLGEDDRESFAQGLASGALFSFLEDCKRDALRTGLAIPDEWLSVLYASHIKTDSPLPQVECDHLGRILGAMYPMLCRLDPDAAPSTPPLPTSTPEQGEGNGGIGAAPAKTRKTKRGRKTLSREETRRRIAILGAWEQARDAGAAMKIFCRELKPSLLVKELEKIVAWRAARDRRKTGN